MAPLYNADLPEAARRIFLDKIHKRFDVIESVLEQNDYLMGTHFGVADAYLYTVARWCPLFDIALARWPAFSAYVDRVGARTAVVAALEAESLD